MLGVTAGQAIAAAAGAIAVIAFAVVVRAVRQSARLRRRFKEVRRVTRLRARDLSWLAALTFALTLAAVAAFVLLPRWVIGDDGFDTVPGATAPSTPNEADLLRARNDVRTAALAMLIGFGTALATGFAGRTFFVTRRGQFTTRYAGGIEQLAHEKSMLTRVGGIHALASVARDSPHDHGPIIDVLTLFVRSTARDADASDDVRAAWSALVNRRSRYDGNMRINLDGADLRNADLEGIDLRRATLRKANLSNANLKRADLFEADLTDAIATSVQLAEANLEGAHLVHTVLITASLDGANAQRADFSGAEFDTTSMKATDLRQASGLMADDGPRTGVEVDEATRLPNGP